LIPSRLQISNNSQEHLYPFERFFCHSPHSIRHTFTSDDSINFFLSKLYLLDGSIEYLFDPLDSSWW
jgi:hypothetical protein